MENITLSLWVFAVSLHIAFLVALIALAQALRRSMGIRSPRGILDCYLFLSAILDCYLFLSAIFRSRLKTIFFLFDPFEQQVDHSNLDQGFAMVGQHLIISGMSAKIHQPRKRALDDPTAW